MSPTCSRRDDQVVARLGCAQAERFRPVATCAQIAACGEVELEELAEQSLAELAVLGEDEAVVEAGDEQDVVDAVAAEILEAGARRSCHSGDRVDGSRSGNARSIGQTRTLPDYPCPIALHQPLIHHRVGDLEEARDVGAVDVVARRAELRPPFAAGSCGSPS